MFKLKASLPENKAFLWQMLERLSGMIVENRNVIHWEEMRYVIKEFFGLPMMDIEEIMKERQMEAKKMGASGLGTQNTEMLQNPDVEGATANGNPARSQLAVPQSPTSKGGGGK